MLVSRGERGGVGSMGEKTGGGGGGGTKVSDLN